MALIKNSLLVRPYFIAIIMFIVAVILIMMDGKSGDDASLQNKFVIIDTFILIFSVYSALTIIITEHVQKIWTEAIFVFLFFIGLLTLIALCFSEKSFSEIGSFRWLHYLLFFAFFIINLIAISIKRIVAYADKTASDDHNT